MGRGPAKEKLTLELLKEERPDIEILSEYINNYTKLKVKCPCGNIYEATPTTLREGHKCRRCTGRYQYNLEELQQIRPDLEILEILSNKRIKYRCPICGEVSQTSQLWLTGKDRTRGCYNCRGQRISKGRTKTKEYLQSKCPDITILGDYINNSTPIKYRCKCGTIHYARPNNLISGNRCWHCRESKGEGLIKEYLDNHNISYMMGYKYDDCRDKKPLPFDFYLSDYNICIEFDGSQHFKSSSLWDKNGDLTIRKQHDKIKTNYCKNKGIKLIRISYKQVNNINGILNRELGIS